jgi:hypothetical protein
MADQGVVVSGVHVEITDEMVAAGVSCLMGWLGDRVPNYWPPAEGLVREVYSDMQAVSKGRRSLSIRPDIARQMTRATEGGGHNDVIRPIPGYLLLNVTNHPMVVSDGDKSVTIPPGGSYQADG